MQTDYRFSKVSDIDRLADLKNKWLESLTSPQDGMWASFRNSAVNYEIRCESRLIGYAGVDDDNQLLQFYILNEYLLQSEAVFEKFIKKYQIKNGIVGTNNPVYLSIALNFVHELRVNTYLFRDLLEVTVNEKEEALKEGRIEDIDRIVDFCHYSMGAGKEWLTGYIGGLIEKREVFVLEKNGEIVGTCEVRKSETAPKFADIGMIVSPDYRKMGYGTFLLNKAKSIAFEQGKIPICSCEKENIGSLKSIHKCGFISRHQLLSIVFK